MSTDLYEHQATVALSADEARRLTDQIKVGIEAVWQLIEQAWQGRVWIALGYSSWDDYCTREFGTSRIKLPREERHEVVASMRELGMSTRAIASATGTSDGTVRNALKAGAQNYAPADPAPVTGTDGKTYNDHARREAGDESSSPSPVIGVDGKSYSRPAPVVESPEDKKRRQEEERAKAREEALTQRYSGMFQAIEKLAGFSDHEDTGWLMSEFGPEKLSPTDLYQVIDRAEDAVRFLNEFIEWRDAR